MRRKPKDKKKINTIMAVFIAVIMISSMAGMMMNNNDSQLSYNGHKFKMADNQIYTEINGETYFFYYFPADLESLNTSEEIKANLKGLQMFYFTFDPDSESLSYIDKARFDLSNDLAKTEFFFANAKTKESDSYDVPIITCDNSTTFVPVIYFKEGNRTGFFQEGNCIIAESQTKEGFLALKDKLLYIILGVM